MRTSRRTLFVGVMAALCAAVGAGVGRANEMENVYELGRALFYQGKFAEAKPLLEQVAAANPRHADTQAMLARIKVMAKGGPTLEERYAGVMLEKIDFVDVTVPEAVDGLRLMAKEASAGKVVPNFVLVGEDKMTETVTLSLVNVPLDKAITYLAQLSGVVQRYEAHAVVLSAPR